MCLALNFVIIFLFSHFTDFIKRMCDCDSCDDVTVTDSTDTGSTKSLLSVESMCEKDVYVPKKSTSIEKSVHFKETVEVYLIPSRRELLTSTISARVKNMTIGAQTQSCLNERTVNDRSKKKPKKVSFHKWVTTFKIPSRKHLQSLFHELWYINDEIYCMIDEAINEEEQSLTSVRALISKIVTQTE